MEVLSDKTKKRTLLAVMGSDSRYERLTGILQGQYEFIRCADYSRAVTTIKKLCDSISAVISEREFITENGDAHLVEIEGDAKLSALPLIMCVDTEIGDEDSQYMDKGVIDILSLGYTNRLMRHIIDNSIRIKDSATFLEIEKMLKELPSLIYLKDSEGKYVFSTHYWHHLKQDGDPNWNIRGKTDIDIRKDKENAIKAQQADMELLRTGKGTAYTIEINEDGVQEFLEIIKQPVRDENGNITGIIGLINNVTDKELLKRQLEEMTKVDRLTGLYSRSYFEQFTAQLGEQDALPVTFISADCNGLKMINDTYGHLVGDEYLRMTALLFRVTLPKDAAVFRVGGDEFIIVLKNTDEAAAGELMEKMKSEEKMFTIKEKTVSISYGSHTIDDCKGCKQYERCSNCVLMAVEQADKEMYNNKRVFKQSEGI